MKLRMLRRIQLGDPSLRLPSKPVPTADINTTKINNLIANMHYTLRRVGGVGIAGVQVGKPVRLFVIDIRPTQHRPKAPQVPKKVVINPRVLSHSKQQGSDYEGCLSFMNFAKVPRASEIKVEYLNADGKKVVEVLSGLEAIVFQHEIDHLNGIVFVDRVVDTKSFMTLSEYKKRIRQNKRK